MNILITGGATGLGEAITRRAAGDPSNKVYFTYCKSKAGAEMLKEELSNTFPVKCDFKNTDELKNLCEQIEHFDLHVLINNAYSGRAIGTHFHKTPPAEFSMAFDENIIPTVRITQAAIHSFRKKKAGNIITILTSFLSAQAPIGSSVYLANKAYLRELTKSWANENIKFNIVSNSVSPAFMLTNFTKGTDPRVLEQLIENQPHKKLLTPAEVAETIFSLIQDGTRRSGVDIVINSGVNIQ